MRAWAAFAIGAMFLTGCVSDDQRLAANQAAGHLSVAFGGVAGKLGYLGAAAMGDGNKSFKVHGNWCGKGFPSDDDLRTKIRAVNTASGVPIVYVKHELMPTDEVDLACARHDICYLMVDGTRQKATRADCDGILMCDMYEIPKLGKQELIKPSGLVLTWVGGAAWNWLSSDCNQLGYKRMIKPTILPDV